MLGLLNLNINMICKLIFFLFFIIGLPYNFYGQKFYNNRVDSLSAISTQFLQEADSSSNDTTKLKLLTKALYNFLEIPDYQKSFPVGLKAYYLAEHLNYKKYIAYTASKMGDIYGYFSNLSKAQDFYLTATTIYEEAKDTFQLNNLYSTLSNLLMDLEFPDKKLEISKKILNINSNDKYQWGYFNALAMVSHSYRYLCHRSLSVADYSNANRYLDSAFLYYTILLNSSGKYKGDSSDLFIFKLGYATLGDPINLCGKVDVIEPINTDLLKFVKYIHPAKPINPLTIYKECVTFYQQRNEDLQVAFVSSYIGRYYENKADYEKYLGNIDKSRMYYDSAIHYFNINSEIINRYGYPHGLGFANYYLASIYYKYCDINLGEFHATASLDNFKKV